MNATREWLEALYGRSPGYFTVITFKDGKPIPRAFSTAELDKVARSIEKTAEKYDVYTSVSTYKTRPEPGRRGSLKDVQSVAGWWADLDIGVEGHKTSSDGKPNPASEAEAMAIIDGLPEPSAVIHSGGGLQVWWLFDEPWVFDDPKAAQKASNEWQQRLKKNADALGVHVDSVGDLPRILRVPGTKNHKTENVRDVVLKSLDGKRYPAAELTVLGESNDETPEPPRGFATWESILEPHGWTKIGPRLEDGAMLWCRPGKTPAEGHSAVTDPYGVPVMVNFSASAGLPTGAGQRLTKFKVWTLLNYGGDTERAKAALEDMAQEDPTLLQERAARFQPLDWPQVFSMAEEEIDWIVPGLLERGRQVAFYSDAKAGKSLLWLEIAARCAAGLEQFTADPKPAKRRRVLYVDLENGQRDIGERLKKMQRKAEELTDWLWYYSFPSIGYLDTKQGALDVLALAVQHDVEFVVIDTLSRVVKGDENENDTYNNFYKYTGVALKSRGIALVRLDHTGKDASKGMRGASSKTTDVDEVWALTVSDNDVVNLRRTHTRSAHGKGEITLVRKDEPFFHHDIDLLQDPAIVKAAEAAKAEKEELVRVLKALRDLGIQRHGSRNAVRDVKDQLPEGITLRRAQEVQRMRKDGIITEDGEEIEDPEA